MTANYGPDTALLVIDIQNDFAHPDGSLYVQGADRVIGAANREIRAAGEAGSPIFYTADWHPPSTPHFAKDGGVWPVHCVVDSWGAQFHDELIVAGDIVKVGTKGEDGYSGFTVRDPETGETSPTGLADRLHELGIDRVVVVGLATDYCVVETAVDAAAEGFETTVVEDAVAAVNLQPDDGDRALDRMRDASIVIA